LVSFLIMDQFQSKSEFGLDVVLEGGLGQQAVCFRGSIDFSQVLALKVLEDVGFSSIVVIFSV